MTSFRQIFVFFRENRHCVAVISISMLFIVQSRPLTYTTVSYCSFQLNQCSHALIARIIRVSTLLPTCSNERALLNPHASNEKL